MSISADHSEHQFLLALEASGDAASVAVMKKGGCLAFQKNNARFEHAQHLVGMVQDVMDEAGATFSEITHIAAGCGPGSFTGLRICLSAAKGYALAVSVPSFGVNGLAALALHIVFEQSDVQAQAQAQAQAHKGPLICFADTRRKSLFAQEFDHQAASLSPLRDIPFDQLSAYLEDAGRRYNQQPLTLAGHMTPITEDLPADKLHSCYQMSADAAMIARYAYQSLSSPQRYPCSGLDPLYVVAPKLGPSSCPDM